MAKGGVTTKVTNADGFSLGLTVFQAEKPKRVVIIASAVGVPQQFYRRYAEFLQQKHCTVITFDYRGTGASKDQSHKSSVALEDWGKQDVSCVIDYAAELASQAGESCQIDYVGHSIGGQIVGLAANAGKLNKIIMVAASAPYWQRWGFPNNLKMWLTGRVIIPAVAFGKREFPAKSLGLGSMKFPSSTARQWAKWMTKPDYLFCDTFGLDLSNYEALTQPLLSYGFEDDELAPEINIQTLLRYFPNAQSEVRMVDPNALAQSFIGHSGFFRDKMKETLWEESLAWLG